MAQDFDPRRDFLFRGKPIDALTQPELRDALVQALQQVVFLQNTPPPGAWPSHVSTEGPAAPIPLPPKLDFSFR